MSGLAEASGNYGKEPCPCGRCHKWFLTGIGSFVRGSGFSEDEADLILAALARAVDPGTTPAMQGAE